MSYIPMGFSTDQEVELLTSQQSLSKQIDQLLELQKREESMRKWTLIIGGLGALFAAVRLGVIALPRLQQRRQRQLGQFGE